MNNLSRKGGKGKKSKEDKVQEKGAGKVREQGPWNIHIYRERETDRQKDVKREKITQDKNENVYRNKKVMNQSFGSG